MRASLATEVRGARRGRYVALTVELTVDTALGLWLFLSPMLWTHSQAQATNSFLLGFLVLAGAFLAKWAPDVRFLNGVLAVWLFISVFVLPTDTATGWSSVLVAIALVATLVANLPGVAATRRTPLHPV
jgi:hypothetical protein